MRTRLWATVVAAVVLVGVCVGLAVALYPASVERSLIGESELQLVRHTNVLGARCFLVDTMSGHEVRTPYRCAVSPSGEQVGGWDVLAMEGEHGGVPFFCLFDRIVSRDLACADGYVSWIRVTPTTVTVVNRRAPGVDVIWVDRASGARTSEHADSEVDAPTGMRVERLDGERHILFDIGPSRLVPGG